MMVVLVAWSVRSTSAWTPREMLCVGSAVELVGNEAAEIEKSSEDWDTTLGDGSIQRSSFAVTCPGKSPTVSRSTSDTSLCSS